MAFLWPEILPIQNTSQNKFTEVHLCLLMFASSLERSRSAMEKGMLQTIRRLWFVLGTAALLGSATEAAEGVRFPVFDGTIIPIELPFQPEYGPHKSVMTFHLVTEGKFAKEPPDKITLDMRIERLARKKGNNLEWTAEVKEMTILGKRLHSRSPLLTARWNSTTNGVVDGFEVDLPGLREMAMRKEDGLPNMSTGMADYDRAFRQFMHKQKLPDKPVISGSVLFTQQISDMVGELQGLTPAAAKGEVRYLVKGWGYYGDQKVLVAESKLDTPLVFEGGDTCSITGSGYELFDVATFALVKTDYLMILSGQEGGKLFHAAVRASGEGKVTNQR